MVERAVPRSLDEAQHWTRSTPARRAQPIGLSGLDGASWAAARLAERDRFYAKADCYRRFGAPLGMTLFETLFLPRAISINLTLGTIHRGLLPFVAGLILFPAPALCLPAPM